MSLHLNPHDAALYATDTLRGRERHAFESHLARCERCRTDLDWMVEVTAALALVVEPVEPPRVLRERILEAARA